MVAKKTETPQWGSAPADTPAFLKKDHPAEQSDIEDFTGSVPPAGETAPQQSSPPAAEPPHDPETGEVLDAPAGEGGDGRPLARSDNEKPKTVVDDVTGTVAGQQLYAFVERIERLNEEKQAIVDDTKEVYAEMKGAGFDTATVRRLVAIRKMDQAKRQEQEAILDLYKAAIGMA